MPQQRISSPNQGSFEKDQEALITGKRKEPDYEAIERHRRFQRELRHGPRLGAFLLARAAMITSGIIAALTGFYFLLMSASGVHIAGGLALLMVGIFLVLRGLVGKRMSLMDMFWFLPW